MQKTFKVVIPARYQSSRFPGKPLVKINGVPMIERTWRQCVQAVDVSQVIIATDDERIESYCRSIGAQVEMTPEDCLTGTDRVAVLLPKYSDDYFINVQGDEPLLNPTDLTNMIAALAETDCEVMNGYTAIHDETDYRSTSIPKVVVDMNGNLMYMSRQAIPASKSGIFQRAWRQVCIYAFSRNALKQFILHPGKTLLESIEDIEIVRFLELGIRVKMIAMSDQSIAVDNPEDVLKVEGVLNVKQ
ncbi:MAG: 3-deoxy-manno-octulosonate cytidylyltransferase [Cyclobacteriaceae bacterium]|nr:3-deoxy-manno-octulosonate cytidylyltransferase [Cyclobacteriaceae bacterium]